jgi:hypothetical protein
LPPPKGADEDTDYFKVIESLRGGINLGSTITAGPPRGLEKKWAKYKELDKKGRSISPIFEVYKNPWKEKIDPKQSTPIILFLQSTNKVDNYMFPVEGAFESISKKETVLKLIDRDEAALFSRGAKIPSYDRSGCSPKIADDFIGIKITAPKQVELGAKSQIPLCGSYRLPAAFISKLSQDTIESILITMTEQKTNAGHSFNLKPDKDKIENDTGEITYPQVGPDVSLDQTGTNTGYFNVDLHTYYPDIPLKEATYIIRASLGKYVSNDIAIKILLESKPKPLGPDGPVPMPLIFSNVQIKSLDANHLDLQIENTSDHDVFVQGDFPTDAPYDLQVWDKRLSRWKIVPRANHPFKIGRPLIGLRLLKRQEKIHIVLPKKEIQNRSRYQLGLYVKRSREKKALSLQMKDNPDLEGGWTYFPLLALTNKIDELVQKLSSLDEKGLWKNGESPDVHLSPTATHEQILSRYFEEARFDQGKVKSYRILETKSIQIQGEAYEALLVDADQGEYVILLQRERTGWWIKPFSTDSR